jgi:hypothetical protein
MSQRKSVIELIMEFEDQFVIRQIGTFDKYVLVQCSTTGKYYVWGSEVIMT